MIQINKLLQTWRGMNRQNYFKCSHKSIKTNSNMARKQTSAFFKKKEVKNESIKLLQI